MFIYGRLIISRLYRRFQPYGFSGSHQGIYFRGDTRQYFVTGMDIFLALVKDIHDNSVRAKIAKIHDEYRWSSHLSYAQKANVGQ
jgi:hypothetical protein